MAEIKQSINNIQINGTLEEMNLVEETKETTISRFINNDKVEKKVTCKVISKKEFSNPTFVVSVNGNNIKVNWFGINFGIAEKALDENGNIVDNDKYKALATIMGKYVPNSACSPTDEPTRVKVSGRLGLNEYASTKNDPNGKWVGGSEIVAFSMSSTNVSEEDSADAEISGVITNIAHEFVNDEDTGRLNVELTSFGYKGVAEPHKFVVENDLADDFEDFYEVGNSVKIYYEVITKHVGGTRVQASGGFGRRDAKITSGFDVTELSVFRGDEPFEEGDYCVSIEDVKNAREEREMMIAKKIQEAVEKANNSSSKPSTTSSAPKASNPFTDAPSNPFGGATKKQNPFG